MSRKGKCQRGWTYSLDQCWFLWFARVLVACDLHPILLNFFSCKNQMKFWQLQWWRSRFFISQALGNPLGTLSSPFSTSCWDYCSLSKYRISATISANRHPKAWPHEHTFYVPLWGFTTKSISFTMPGRDSRTSNLPVKPSSTSQFKLKVSLSLYCSQ
jgi:hypothetical protein